MSTLNNWMWVAAQQARWTYEHRTTHDSDAEAVNAGLNTLKMMFNTDTLHLRHGQPDIDITWEAERVYRDTCEELFDADHIVVGQ